jgi:hypothetical protein
MLILRHKFTELSNPGSHILILAKFRNRLGRLFKKRNEKVSYSRLSTANGINFLHEKLANVAVGGREAYERGLAGLEGNSDKTNQSFRHAD